MTPEEIEKIKDKLLFSTEEEQIKLIWEILDGTIPMYGNMYVSTEESKILLRPYKPLLGKMRIQQKREIEAAQKVDLENKKLEDFPPDSSNEGYTIYNTNK